MTSKLEAHSEIILNALDNGHSYRFIADKLLLLGVEITPQSIWSWHSRRVQRIDRRRSVARPASAPTPRQPTISPVSHNAVADPASIRSPAALRGLRELINEQARQQEANPLGAGINRFLVRR